MKIKNEHEQYIVNCLENNEIYKELQTLLSNVNNNVEKNRWILSQTDYDDKCMRLLLINDRRVIVYGDSYATLKAEKKNPGSELFENAPATVLEFTNEPYKFHPIYPLKDAKGKVRVDKNRILTLFTEMIMEFMKATHPDFKISYIKNFIIEGSGCGYCCFDYLVPPLNWKNWW